MNQPAKAKLIAQKVHIEFSPDGALWIANAKWQDSLVGYAHCTRTGDRLLLGDLLVKDDAPVLWPVLDRLRQCLRIPCRRLNLRNQGVGSRLLERLLAEARRAGIKEIWGSVVQRDLDRNPRLLDWYARHGFTVGSPDADCIPAAVRKITLGLGKA